MIYLHYILVGFCVAVGLILGGGLMGAILTFFKKDEKEVEKPIEDDEIEYDIVEQIEFTEEEHEAFRETIDKILQGRMKNVVKH